MLDGCKFNLNFYNTKSKKKKVDKAREALLGVYP